jgi:hypothetical protein
MLPAGVLAGYDGFWLARFLEPHGIGSPVAL